MTLSRGTNGMVTGIFRSTSSAKPGSKSPFLYAWVVDFVKYYAQLMLLLWGDELTSDGEHCAPT